MIKEFYDWIMTQKDPLYTIEKISEDQIDLVTETAAAHIQFYHLEYDIVSFTIDSPKDEEPLFFLHFELQDLDHAKKLFTEMTDSLKKAAERVSTKILLSCSSGFTTSFFADKLNTAAKTLGVDYTFSAVSYTDLFQAAEDQDVILLAPQIGYLYKKASEVLKDKIVLQIPTDVFASYNVSRMLEILQEAVKQKESEPEITENIDDPEWDRKIMILAILRNQGKYAIHYRGADREESLQRGVVIKEKLDLNDIDDLLNVLFLRYPDLAGAAIVSPGVVNNGRLTWTGAGIRDEDIVGRFTKKYGRTITLCNDANAITKGYYANHQDTGDLLVYYHPMGAAIGGAGMILNGQMHMGKNDFAGEVPNYIKLLNFSEDRFELARTPEGIAEFITKVTVPMICTVGPETLAVCSDLLTDTEELQQRIGRYIPEAYMPKIVKVERPLWHLFYGAGVQLYNVLHGTQEYREDLKEYRK
jgi:cellobiose-specific phosphotransferase system component IIB